MKYSLRSLIQFTIRDVLWLMTVAALILALIYTKRPLAAPTPPPMGRYQLVSDPGQRGTKYILDTATGKMWYQAGHGTFWYVYVGPDYDK
jgi:hypothetical protein